MNSRRKRIDPETDVAIIMEFSNGTLNKDIAEMFNVSPSYVSKLKTGKKAPRIHVSNVDVLHDARLTTNKTDIEAVLTYVMELDTLVTRAQIISFLEDKLNYVVIQVKIYQELLKKYKGE